MKTRQQLDQIKDMIRHPYAWPGGYHRLAVMLDGGVLCPDCLRTEYANVLHSTKYGYRDGWAWGGEFINWEDTDCYCDHCGNRIPSEYAD